MRKYLLLLILSFITYSCDMFEAHPYDGKVTGETNINIKNSKIITSNLKDKNEIKFAMISDTHRWYDETKDFVKAINRRNDIDFVVHGGDQTDFGTTDEFTWLSDIMNGINKPWIVTIGNHDCLGSGKYVFEKKYGKVDFAFTAGKTRFMVLNTNALEYNYFSPVPNFTFLEDELNNIDSEIKSTIFLMHVRPYDYMFNDNVAKLFEEQIRKFPNVQFCIYGHGHKFSSDDLFGDGIIYYQCPSIEKHTYLVFTVNEKGYTYEKSQF